MQMYRIKMSMKLIAHQECQMNYSAREMDDDDDDMPK